MSLPAIIDEAAKTYGMSGNDFVYTLKTTAVIPKEAKDAEVVSCIMVAHEHGLNPLTREIYFMKTKAGGIQPIVSVDGWIKKCNEHPKFDGMEFTDTLDDAGKLVSITCTIYRKDRSHATSATEYMAECRRKSDKQTPWDSHPSRMLRHKALIQCARIAFGFAGIMEPDEFAQWQEGIKDITPKPAIAAVDSNDLHDLPDVIDDIEDIPDVVDADIADEEPDLIADVPGFLGKVRQALKDGWPAGDVYATYGELAERLPEDARGKFDRMLEEAA